MTSKLSQDDSDRFNQCQDLLDLDAKGDIDDIARSLTVGGLDRHMLIKAVVTDCLKKSGHAFNINDIKTQHLCNLSLKNLNKPETWRSLSEDDRTKILYLLDSANQMTKREKEMDKSFVGGAEKGADIIANVATFASLSSHPLVSIPARFVNAAMKTTSFCLGLYKAGISCDESIGEKELQYCGSDFFTPEKQAELLQSGISFDNSGLQYFSSLIAGKQSKINADVSVLNTQVTDLKDDVFHLLDKADALDFDYSD